jgi:hypothetical protein
MQLLQLVDAVAKQFRPVFRRHATYVWFVIVFWAVMLRMDMAGVTSIVRCLGLAPNEYFNLLNFFHSSAFCVTVLCLTWSQLVFAYAQPVRLQGRALYVVDGIKVGKAGRRMPGVKLLHQESDDNTKPDYIMGHFWGAIGLLVHAPQHVFSIPLRFQIQDGLKRSPSEVATLVDKMGTLVTQTVDQIAGTVMGDIYYSTQGFLTALRQTELHYIGKVKSCTVAYHQPPPPAARRGRGRPRKYGAKVKLKQLFDQPQLFQPASVQLYSNLQDVHYHSVDLLWQGFYVRFVLSIMPDGQRAILLSTDRTLEPEAIIYAYGLRQKIEVSFKALVHTLCGFGYHFWMSAMPKLKRGAGNQYLHRAGEAFRKQVYRKIEAYERFVNICAIALGTLQLLAIRFPGQIWKRFPVWLRTLPKHGCPSEHVVRLTLQHELHQIFLKSNDSPLLAKTLATKKAGAYPPHPIKIAA